MHHLRPLQYLLILIAIFGGFSLANAQTAPGAPLVAVAPATSPQQSTVLAYPEGTFMVARLSSLASLWQANDKLTQWLSGHPSVQSFWADQFPGLGTIDLKQMFSQSMDMTPEEMDLYFHGPLMVYVSNDFSQIETSQSLPVAFVFQINPATAATDVMEKMKTEEGVTEVIAEVEGIQHLRIESTPVADESADPLPEPAQPQYLDLYVGYEGDKFVAGSSLDYTLATLRSIRTPAPSSNVFWAKAGNADLAIWLDPRVFFAKVKEIMEKKAKESPGSANPEILNQLGFNELEGLGITCSFAPLKIEMELAYTSNPQGIARLFSCTPTGLEASSLIPSDVDEFSLGRTDMACAWAELRRLAKVVMPASEPMYQGWRDQLKEKYGVDFDKQFFGALDTRYVTYVPSDAGDYASSATCFYLALNDSASLQASIQALTSFFSAGKELFDREDIANVPVWRVKSSLQPSGTPPVAYAITPKWFILSIGAPTQIQDLIERAEQSQIDNSILQRPGIRQMLSEPSLTSFGYRPLGKVMQSLAQVAQEVQRRQATTEGAPAEQTEIPSFEDITEGLVGTTTSRDGSLTWNLQVVPANE